MTRSKKNKIFSLIITFFIVVGLFAFMFSGDNFKIVKSLFREDISEAEFKYLLQSFGYRGSITLSLLSMLQVVLTFLPAEPVQVLAGIGYGLLEGFFICLVGVFVGNSLVYLFYKLFGDKLADYFHKNIDVDFDKIRNSKRMAFIIFLLYFLPAIPYGLICFFSASMDLKYHRYIFLTTVGAIPSILIGVGMGHLAMATSWIFALIIFAVIVVALIVLTIKRKAVFEAINKIIRKNQQNAPIIVRKASPFIYHSVRLGCKCFARKLKYSLTAETEVKGPCIVLCSHGSFLDFIYSGFILQKQKPHYIVARLYFYNKRLSWLLQRMGAFPKSMFATDMENVKNCLKVLSSGEVLAMMPEARLSTIGKFEDIQDSTVKFIKKMKMPVYGIKIDGSYLADPKWGDGKRSGAHVEATLTQIASKEEIENLSQKSLKDKIVSVIGYDDFKWLETKPEYKYKSKTLAEGLQNILFKCPGCGKELTIETNGRTISCSECGLKTSIDDRYAFDEGVKFNNFAEWYEWQKDQLVKEINSSKEYALSDKVQLKLSSLDGKTLVRHAGEGVCTLNANGLTYKGTIDGEEVVKEFPMSVIYRLLFGAGVDFEIYQDKEIYFFVPEDKRSCVKWYIVSEILKTQSEIKTEEEA